MEPENENGESAASNQIAKDVAVMVGGNFTPDHLGPLYNRIRERALARPGDYLRTFEQLYLARPMNVRAQSNFHPTAVLKLLDQKEPSKVRQLASRLLTLYDTAMGMADSLLEEEGTLEALPNRTNTMVRRLSRRRDALRRIAQGSGT